MRTVVFVSLLAFAAVAYAVPINYYSDKYDNINLEEILSNRRLLIPYLKCALDQGKCSADGKEMRAHLKDAMETECLRCTPKQKKNAERVIRHMVRFEKDYWQQLKDKYDPEGAYFPKYEADAIRLEAEDAARQRASQ